MKYYKLFFLALLVSGFTISCSEDEDDIGPKTQVEGEERDLTIENFVFRGMKNIYLYKADIPELENNFFNTQVALQDFLKGYASPEDLFYEGLVSHQDKFSWIVDDYVELENMFSGISTTTGMSYVLSYYNSSSDDIFGVIRYVQPGTSAEENGLKRGDIFTKIDGQQLKAGNYSALLAPDSFTISLATIEGDDISETGEEKTLTKAVYNSNPVYIAKTLNVDGKKIGYLMYNSFTDEYDEDLNAAFGQFKADNVEELVLDLRYNGGGSVRTATDLAAMITGQFPGEIFLKEEWNTDYQSHFLENNPDRLINKFNTTLSTGTPINSLNLDQVYVLTSNRSASASELIINGLDPYINVIQVGDRTTGKFTASVTLYDSQNFGRQGARTTHTYAIQPLVFKSVNAAGVSDYINGLDPDVEFLEDIRNYGELGNEDEPLLQAALNHIQGNRISRPADFKKYEFAGENGMFDLDYQRMYTDKLPPIISEE